MPLGSSKPCDCCIRYIVSELAARRRGAALDKLRPRLVEAAPRASTPAARPRPASLVRRA